MEALERVLIVEACRDLVLRSVAAMDANAPAQLADLFTDEGEIVRPNGSVLRGREAIRASYSQRSAERITRHLVTNIVVDVHSTREASSVSYVMLWSGSTTDAEAPQGRPVQREQVGEFEDGFVHTPTGWRIARRAARFILSSD